MLSAAPDGARPGQPLTRGEPGRPLYYRSGSPRPQGSDEGGDVMVGRPGTASAGAAVGATNHCGGPAATARRESLGASEIPGAPAAPARLYTSPTSWDVNCLDTVGRLRKLTVRCTPDGGASLAFPPGEAATLLRGHDTLLAAVTDRALRTRPGRQR